MNKNQKKLLLKTAFFILSLSLAWWLIKSGFLYNLVQTIMPLRFVSEIVAGLFYTSFLTAPISLAMLVVLAQVNNSVVIALLAGLGAALGDFLIIKFFRDELSTDLNLISKELHLKKIKKILYKYRLDSLAPLLGAVIIASPFPDEIGLLMLGVSKLKYYQIALLTYLLNTAGILLLLVPVNLIS